ncbi:MAG: hypothetical protein LBK95_02225 [Bifidobacteriaceae bacterium]|nr:hypothetical protein [Bifidobacteriaceae bacterium]
MPEITPTQVHNLLVRTHEYMASSKQTGQTRDRLGHLLLDTARQAKTSPRDLSAVTGLHHATIRALISRAAGNGSPDGRTQPAAIRAQPARTASAAVASAPTPRAGSAAAAPRRAAGPGMGL